MRVGKTATRVGKSGMLQSIVQIQRKRVSRRKKRRVSFIRRDKTCENVTKIRKWPFEKENGAAFSKYILDIFKKFSNIDLTIFC